jgi:hypothetical protein
LEILDNRLTKFLFAVEAVGIIFVGFFLVAYLSGLPTTAVLHSELVFRIPLFVFGVVLLLFVLATVFIAASKKKS